MSAAPTNEGSGWLVVDASGATKNQHKAYEIGEKKIKNEAMPKNLCTECRMRRVHDINPSIRLPSTDLTIKFVIFLFLIDTAAKFLRLGKFAFPCHAGRVETAMQRAELFTQLFRHCIVTYIYICKQICMIVC